MKRKSQILVRVTPDEKAIIQASADSIGINVSRLLRVLGLKAKGLHQIVSRMRPLIAQIMRINALSKQHPVPQEELRSAIKEALQRVQSVEEALQVPPSPEHLE